MDLLMIMELIIINLIMSKLNLSGNWYQLLILSNIQEIWKCILITGVKPIELN